jgi:hypothetical protein
MAVRVGDVGADSWLDPREETTPKLAEGKCCVSLLKVGIVEREDDEAETPRWFPSSTGHFPEFDIGLTAGFRGLLVEGGVVRACTSCPFEPALTSSCCLLKASLSTDTPGCSLRSFKAALDFWPGSLNVNLCEDGSGVLLVLIFSLIRGTPPSPLASVNSVTNRLASATRRLK